MPESGRAIPGRPSVAAWVQPAARAGWWLWARLVAVGRRWADGLVGLVEDGRLVAALRAAGRRLGLALRWARAHDTVPRGTRERSVRHYEQRLERAERREAQRRQWRQEKEAARLRREQKYSEKSSMYLG